MEQRSRLVLLALLACGVGFAPAAQAQFRPGTGTPFDDARRAAAIDSIATALERVYIFEDVADRMEKLIRKNLKKGVYDSLVDPVEFTDRLTEDLRSVSHDLHLRVYPIDPIDAVPMEADVDALDLERRQRAELARNNFGFRKLEILPGNVGYLRLDGFNPAYFGGDTAVAAMNFLAHCDALIIDLRNNGGGSPSMIQLITSYFLDEPTLLNSFYIRQTDETHQFWTAEHVEGPRLANTDLFVLTSGRTFSAAEEFTYNLKNLDRATIVGETTGGGAHPVEGHVFGYVNVGMSLPFGRAINPITGTNWEGVGVTPDIEVPAEEALDTAHLEALRAVRDRAEDPARIASLEWGLTELEARLRPVAIDPAALVAFVGQYGDRRISGGPDSLWYRRGDRSPMRMIPMSTTLFRFEEIDQFRLEVELGDGGEPIGVIGHYADGRTDQSPRTGD